MPTITKEKKKEIIDSLRQNISKQEAIFFVNYKGLKGDNIGNLRNALQKNGSRLIVTRKTLAKIAFTEEGIDFDPLTLEGEVGFIFSFEDGVTTAKTIAKFSKEKVISFLGGFYEGRVLSGEEVNALSEIPSREELLAQLVGSLSAPTTGFVQVLQGNIRGLLTVLSKAKV